MPSKGDLWGGESAGVYVRTGDDDSLGRVGGNLVGVKSRSELQLELDDVDGVAFLLAISSQLHPRVSASHTYIVPLVEFSLNEADLVKVAYSDRRREEPVGAVHE